MSGVVRPYTNRSRTRNAISSPYARPRQQKKSGWSVTSLLSYLNPFAARPPSPERSPSPTVPPESPTPEVEEAQQLPEAVHNLAERGHEMTASLSNRPALSRFGGPSSSQQHTPTHGSSNPPLVSPSLLQSESPAKNLETVSTFLNSKVGQPITPIEMEGVLSLLQRSTPQEGPTPFRFDSRSPSATPARGISPFVPTPTFKFSTPEPFASVTPSATSRRTLSKNPNGVYRWQGGGSARTSRAKNRFSSPAFGPSRSSNEHIVLKDDGITESSKSDNKRRRVGEDAASSISSPASVQKSTSPATTSAPHVSLPAKTTPSSSPVKSSAPTSSARLRMQKLTAPVVPSPLRQAWSEGSSPGEASKSPVSKPSKAANFMAELIKETTPPKKPDVSNPYQTANPVGKVGPRRVPKRTRASAKAAREQETVEKEKEKEKELKQITPQAIIEATLPKGSKRSRPPAHFEKTPEKVSFVVEEVEEEGEEDHRVGKKSKPSLNGDGPSLPSTMRKSASSTPEIIIEEVQDVEMASSNKRKAKPEEKEKETRSSASPGPSGSRSPPGNRVFGYKPSSIPKEPSKLRFSLIAEGNSPVPVRTSPSLPSMDTQEDPGKAKEEAQSLTAPSLPAFTFTNTGTSVFPSAPEKLKANPAVPSDPKQTACALATSSLPTFTFTNSGTSVLPSTPEHIKAREQARGVPKVSLKAFDFSPDALKSQAKANNSSASASISATISTPAPASGGFNWAAAGMKPPPAPTAGSWTCSVCMISNSSSKDICAACESPR